MNNVKHNYYLVTKIGQNVAMSGEKLLQVRNIGWMARTEAVNTMKGYAAENIHDSHYDQAGTLRWDDGGENIMYERGLGYEYDSRNYEAKRAKDMDEREAREAWKSGVLAEGDQDVVAEHYPDVAMEFRQEEDGDPVAYVVFDNGGGITLHLGGRYVGFYDGQEQAAATDLQNYLENGTTEGWEMDPQLEGERLPSMEDVRNGGYLFRRYTEWEEVVGDTFDEGWANIERFGAEVLNAENTVQ